MKLAVVTQDHISSWKAKGEVLQGYFNPDDKFDSVDIILLNDDAPDIKTLATLCGNASFRLYNLPLLTKKVMLLTLGWRPFLLHLFTKALVKWSLHEPADVIRAYESNLASYCAMKLSNSLSCGFAISLHSTPDNKALYLYSTFKDRLVRRLTQRVGKLGFQGANLVIAVYKSIIPALTDELKQKTVWIPNVVGIQANYIKTSYRTEGPVRLIATGRLVLGKSPLKFIEALSQNEDFHLTIVGDGPLKDQLIKRVKELKLQSRVEFIRRMDNEQLCSALKSFDAYVFHTDYQECPKTLIEAALVGLPIVCSNDLQTQISELKELSLINYDEKLDGISHAYQQLLSEKLRREIGLEISNKAHKIWSPKNVAIKTAKVFVSLVENNKSGNFSES